MPRDAGDVRARAGDQVEMWKIDRWQEMKRAKEAA